MIMIIIEYIKVEEVHIIYTVKFLSKEKYY